MRNILTRSSLFFIVLVVVASSCHSGGDSLKEKKNELDSLKTQQEVIRSQVLKRKLRSWIPVQLLNKNQS